MKDLILIRGLRCWTHLGVPELERAVAQEIEMDLELAPQRTLFGLEDDIKQTIDYAEVAALVEKEAARVARALLERLGEDVLNLIGQNYPVASATIELRKFVVPGTAHVGVRMSKSFLS